MVIESEEMEKNKLINEFDSKMKIARDFCMKTVEENQLLQVNIERYEEMNTEYEENKRKRENLEKEINEMKIKESLNQEEYFTCKKSFEKMKETIKTLKKKNSILVSVI